RTRAANQSRELQFSDHRRFCRCRVRSRALRASARRRAQNTTSSPAALRRAPKEDPTAPAPLTRIFIGDGPGGLDGFDATPLFAAAPSIRYLVTSADDGSRGRKEVYHCARSLVRGGAGDSGAHPLAGLR